MSNIITVPNLKTVEAILKGNNERRTIASNTYFNDLLLGKGSKGRFNDVPNEFMQIRPWHTGTAFVVEAKGKAFEKSVEKEIEHAGQKKVLIYRLEQEHRGLVDKMLLSDHGFAGDTQLMSLLNAKNGKPIANLGEADEIILKFNGEIRVFEVKNRRGGGFEIVENEWSVGWVSEVAALGLLGRGDGGIFHDGRRFVYAGVFNDKPRGTLFVDGTL